MNDATTPWIDPELIAAGRLLQEKGFVVAQLAPRDPSRPARSSIVHRGSIRAHAARFLDQPAVGRALSRVVSARHSR